jgi:hypothetical protein
MSYSTDRDNTSVYTASSDHGAVNTVSDYHTLKNYYSTPSCPYTTAPGQTLVQPVFITPSFGGSGYSNLQHNVPGTQLPDSNYFSMANAYPAFPYSPCMRPLFS